MCQLIIQFGHCIEEIFASLFSSQGKMGGEVNRALRLTSKDTKVTVNLIFIEIKFFIRNIETVSSLIRSKIYQQKHTPDSEK